MQSRGAKVAVVGAGAVGCFFGGMLARAGAAVTFVGRPGSKSEHMRLLRERGLVFDGVEIQETIPVAVSRVKEALDSAEVVLFAVKTLDTETAAEGMRPHLAPEVLVVSLQNGIDNVDRMKAVGVEAIPSVVIVAAAIDTPGTVRHRGRGDLILGHPECQEEVEGIATLFRAADVPCVVSDHIRRDQWSKLVLNSMSNPISALADASYKRLAEFQPTWELALSVVREGLAVARAEGIEISEDAILEQGLAIMRNVGDATSSTQQDIAHGRKTEIDSLNGFIARRGAELGVATPANDALWALIKLREGS